MTGFITSRGNVYATSGSGAPTSTPNMIGDLYTDTTLGVTYVAQGVSSSADWKALIST